MIRDRTTKDEAWLKIDTPTARALCVSAVACSRWLLLDGLFSCLCSAS